MKKTTCSIIIDSTTSMTENDVLRMYKGCLRRNMSTQALYCLKILERNKHYFDRVYQMTILLFFELGIANDFPDLLSELIAVSDFALLQGMVVKMCCRGSNHMAFVPDMLGRIVGYSTEKTLTTLECFGHLQYPALMNAITALGQQYTCEQPTFAQQVIVASIFNMMETTILSYIPAWQALRCVRLALFLYNDAGKAETFWQPICTLPIYYPRWRGLREWINQCHALFLRVKPANSVLWDKRRAIMASVVCGLLYGIQERVTLEEPAEICALRPELFPEWFYSTQPAPNNILYRVGLPDTMEQYLKKKYPRYSAHWAELYAELRKLCAQMSMEMSEVSVAHQTALFRDALASTKFILPPGSPALRLHAYVTDGAVKSSRRCDVNDNMLILTMIKADMASILPTSILCYNGSFRAKYGAHLEPILKKLPKTATLELLYGGPFVESKHVVTLVLQMVLFAYTDIYDVHGACEPYIHCQVSPAGVTFLTVNLCTAWQPVTQTMLSDTSACIVRQMWTLGWIFRFLLLQQTTYAENDFVYTGSGDCMMVLWLTGLYPDQREFVEDECIENLMRHSSAELYSMCMLTLEDLFAEETFATYVEKVMSKKRDEFRIDAYRTIRGMVIEFRNVLRSRYDYLATLLSITGHPVKRQKIAE